MVCPFAPLASFHKHLLPCNDVRHLFLASSSSFCFPVCLSIDGKNTKLSLFSTSLIFSHDLRFWISRNIPCSSSSHLVLTTLNDLVHFQGYGKRFLDENIHFLIFSHSSSRTFKAYNDTTFETSRNFEN